MSTAPEENMMRNEATSVYELEVDDEISFLKHETIPFQTITIGKLII